MCNARRAYATKTKAALKGGPSFDCIKNRTAPDTGQSLQLSLDPTTEMLSFLQQVRSGFPRVERRIGAAVCSTDPSGSMP